MNKLKAKKGITLIALVITIIVLLILAGISITAITGENGIANKAKYTQEKTKIAKEQEQADLESLEEYINNNLGESSVDWDSVLADATVNSDEYLQQAAELGQDINTNTAIGIGTDGKVVNMDLWKYEYLSSGKTSSSSYDFYENPGLALALPFREMATVDPGGKAYLGEIKDGKIIGTIPQSIKYEEDGEFVPVTILLGTFIGCTELTTIPQIPDTVKNMCGTFSNCIGIKNVKGLPDNSIIDFSSTFSYCTNLTSVEIPKGVINMHGTFTGCTNLTKVSKIPNSVTIMEMTFKNCTSLVESPEIPAGITKVDSLFWGCTSLTKAPTFQEGLNSMGYVFMGCTSLTTAPQIPSSVTNMNGTFWNCTNLTGTIEINCSLTS